MSVADAAPELPPPARPSPPAHPPSGRTRSARREIAAAVGGCLLGAALVLFSGGGTWASGNLAAGTVDGVVAPLAVEFSGGDLAPAVSALGLAGLAAVVAVVATRRTGRFLTGVLLLVVGAGIVYLASRVLADPWAAVAASSATSDVAPDGVALVGDLERGPAGWVAALGGLTLAAAGLLVVARGSRWPSMSARYERRTPAATDAWEAIERGDDPT